MTTLSISPFLWYDGTAEEAANFYVLLFPDSHVDNIVRAPGDNPSGNAGDVLLVEFTLMGRPFQALNGGPAFQFNEAFSLSVTVQDQAEVDRLWDALTADGGAPSQCGWLKDRWGLSWQIVPEAMQKFLTSSDREGAARAFAAMQQMSKLNVEVLERAFQGIDG